MTREEALNEIKSWAIPSKEGREVLKTLIPELAESEDERIRKYFIWIVKNVLDNIQGLKLSEEQTRELIDNYSGIKESDMIAWLEKQKEPHYTKRNALFDKCVENCDPTVMKKVSDEVDEMLEKENQKEQKPVECIKFDNEFENQVSHLIASILNGEHEYNEGFVKYVAQSLLGYANKEQKSVGGKQYYSPDCGTSACCDDERFEIIAQAKKDIIEKTNIAENELSMELSLLDGILLRVWQVGWLNKKPAEWSEEDDMLMDELESYILYDKEFNDEQKSWRIKRLKSLRPQPKLEWDEYIKTNLDRALQIIKKAKGTLQGYQSDDGIYECDHAIQTLECILKNGIEQKPAEKSEIPINPEWHKEDEQNLNAVLGYIRDEALRRWLIDTIHNQYDKPAEWGVEDKDRIRQIERIAQQAGCTQKLQEEIHDWLKSLKPKWKPSEQEKGALRTAIYVLTEERNFPKAAEQLQAILDVFDGKESRKDWKPSDEQMEALRECGECKRCIKKLYEQLKRL